MTCYRLIDKQEGMSSCVVGLPEGNLSEIVGNFVEQGPKTLNHGIISFASDDLKHARNKLSDFYGSIFNRDLSVLCVRNHKDLDIVLANNLFGGDPIGMVAGSSQLNRNLVRAKHGMTDPSNYDFRLAAGAFAIVRGLEIPFDVQYENVHPMQGRSRHKVWRPDVGALKRCGL